MRKKFTTVGKSRAVILPKELLELYGFGDELEILPGDGGVFLRPARAGLSFTEATARVLKENEELLIRLSKA